MLNREFILIRAKNKGLSMHQLALKCDISKSYFYRLMNGEKDNPSIKTIEKIAYVLKCDFKQLIIWEDKKNV